MITISSNNHADTFARGRRLGQLAKNGIVVALRGELGAGKTVFAKGVGDGLGLTHAVTSPTYVLMQVYPSARIPLVHADLYRLAGFDEVLELGLEERYADSVVLIEWSERCVEILPADHIIVDIHFRGEGRLLEISATGPIHQAFLEQWLE